jgi:hypothetical protein
MEQERQCTLNVTLGGRLRTIVAIATMSCILLTCVTFHNIKMLIVGQKRFYGEFI